LQDDFLAEVLPILRVARVGMGNLADDALMLIEPGGEFIAGGGSRHGIG